MGEPEANNFPNIDFVFLDRDGVLNRSTPERPFVTRWEEFDLLPGVAEAIALLNQSGRKVIVVTNQRCVALGLCTESELVALHERLQDNLARQGARLDAIYYCPHSDGQCNCRKPLPGMFERAFCDFPGARASNSIMIGDSLRDIEAGTALGMRTVFVDDTAALGKRSQDAERSATLASAVACSLLDCVQRYLSASAST